MKSKIFKIALIHSVALNTAIKDFNPPGTGYDDIESCPQ